MRIKKMMWNPKLTFLILLIFSQVIIGCSEQKKIENAAKTTIKYSDTVTIGAKPVTEQALLMKMTAILLKENGFQTKELTFMDSPSIRKGLEHQAIDLYWEYTNTALIFFHKKPPIFNRDEAYKAVAKEDLKKGIIWLPRSNFNSTWVVLMREDLSNQLNIHSISELAHYMKQNQSKLKFASNEEFLSRGDGMRHLQKIYGFSMDPNDVITVDNNLLSQAVEESRVQVAVGWSADSRIREYKLVRLKDDQGAFPPYDATPVMTQEIYKKYPKIPQLLKQLSSKITNEKMVELNYQVEVLNKNVSDVAREFLQDSGLIPKT
jgi:osmoprotectant transport system substrate-binding protein